MTFRTILLTLGLSACHRQVPSTQETLRRPDTLAVASNTVVDASTDVVSTVPALPSQEPRWRTIAALGLPGQAPTLYFDEARTHYNSPDCQRQLESVLNDFAGPNSEIPDTLTTVIARYQQTNVSPQCLRDWAGSGNHPLLHAYADTRTAMFTGFVRQTATRVSGSDAGSNLADLVCTLRTMNILYVSRVRGDGRPFVSAECEQRSIREQFLQAAQQVSQPTLWSNAIREADRRNCSPPGPPCRGL